MNNRYPLRSLPVRDRDYTAPGINHVVDLLNTWFPPTPITSPDELVIQQRGRRRSPTKLSKLPATSYGTDFESFESPVSSGAPWTPLEGSTPLKYGESAAIRKRLLMTPDSPSQPQQLSKTLTPPFKKARSTGPGPRRTRNSLKMELSALSNQQLITVITNIAEKYSIQKEVRSALPAPDVTPLVDNLEFFSRNIRRSLPTSRLMRDAAYYRRVKTHLDNFKQACTNQGRQLEECCAWRALILYVKGAWPVVQRLPVWCQGTQNRTKLVCVRSLVNSIKMAAKSGELSRVEVEQLIKWCEERKTEFPPLVSCVKILQDLIRNKQA